MFAPGSRVWMCAALRSGWKAAHDRLRLARGWQCYHYVAACLRDAALPLPVLVQETTQTSITDSDSVFLLKLAATSFALGGAIKYGSLLLALPFEPSAAAAVFFVLAPPLIWSAIKLAQSQQES